MNQRRGSPVHLCKTTFGLPDSFPRNIPSKFLDASTLPKWNWEIPQFHHRLPVLISMMVEQNAGNCLPSEDE